MVNTPNWKRLGMKNVEECIKYVLSFLKKNEEIIANAGFGHHKVLDGKGNTLLELKGDPKIALKRKKQTIQI